MIKQKQKQQVMGETLSCDGITLVPWRKGQGIGALFSFCRNWFHGNSAEKTLSFQLRFSLEQIH